MPSSVSTSFELKELNSYLQGISAANKALDSFATKTVNFANLKPPSVNTSAVDNDLKAATAQIKLYETERINIAKSNSALAIDLKKAETKSLADEAKAQTRTFKNELNSISGLIKSESAKSSTSLKELAGVFGLAFGAKALVGGGIQFLKDSTTAAFDAERANRKLSAAATEAGLSYGVLADKNRDFAKSAGLSETAATSITAKITQLATFAGKPQEVDKLQKAFLDLSAAKGIGSSEIDHLIGTILSGQDEGLNRLGISDPGQLYKAYAKEIGTTADALSQYQKVQAATNAVAEKAAVFTGANADKMESLSGKAELASSQIENLYTNFGKGLTQTKEFRDGVQLLSDVLGGLSLNVSDVRSELEKGLTPKQIAEKNADGFGAKTIDFLKDNFGKGFATVALPFDIYNEGFGAAKNKFIETSQGARKRRIEEDTKAVEAEQKLNDTQKKNAEEQKNLLSSKTFATNFQSQIDSFLKPASDGVEKTRITLQQLNKLQKDFTANIKNFNQSQAELAQKGIDTAAKSFYTGSAEDAVKAFSRNPNIADARTDLATLESIKKFIPTEKFEDFKDKFSDFITNDIKKAKEKTEELSRKATDTFDGLFIKLNKDNPIASVFSEGTKELDKLKESLKGLSPELQSQGLAIQTKLNNDNLFSARLDNDLSALDFRQKAFDLRNFGKDPNKPNEVTLDKRDPNKFFNDYIEFYTKRLEADFLAKGGGATKFYRTANGGFTQVNEQPFTQFNRTANNGFIQTDSRLALNTVFEQLGNGGSFRRDKTLADLTNQEKFDFLNKDNVGLQNKLDAAFGLAKNRAALNPEQESEINRKILSLAASASPEQLRGDQRELVATAAEKEATRREAYESKAQAERISQTALQSRIADGIDKLNLIAEKEGFQAVEVILKDQTAAGAEVKKQTKTADRSDVENHYTLGTVSGSKGLTNF